MEKNTQIIKNANLSFLITFNSVLTFFKKKFEVQMYKFTVLNLDEMLSLVKTKD